MPLDDNDELEDIFEDYDDIDEDDYIYSEIPWEGVDPDDDLDRE